MILEGFSEQEIKKREDYNAQILLLLKEQASYEKYLRIAQSDDLISKEKWGFFAKNYQSDASGDLKNFTTPVHLVLGGQDINVDVEETERVYREKFLKTYSPSSIFLMLITLCSQKECLITIKNIFDRCLFPRHIVVEPYLDDLVHFVSQF